VCLNNEAGVNLFCLIILLINNNDIVLFVFLYTMGIFWQGTFVNWVSFLSIDHVAHVIFFYCAQ